MPNPAVATTMLDHRRAEESIVRQANAYLHGSPYLPLRALFCELDRGVLTVRGNLPTFYLKQLAFAGLMRRLGGCEINDLTEVTWPGEAARLKRLTSIGVLRFRHRR
jgi:hypothetical protein